MLGASQPFKSLADILSDSHLMLLGSALRSEEPLEPSAFCVGKAHDVMALKCYSGPGSPQLNFPKSSYDELLPHIEAHSKVNLLAV